MKLTSTIISLVALFSFASAGNVMDAYHNDKYDNKENSISSITCYQSLHATYKHLGDLPNYPYIGGYKDGNGCGSCWEIVYGTNSPITIYVLSVDNSNSGFQLSVNAMNTLTNGHGTQYVSIAVQVTAADKSKCGL